MMRWCSETHHHKVELPLEGPGSINHCVRLFVEAYLGKDEISLLL